MTFWFGKERGAFVPLFVLWVLSGCSPNREVIHGARLFMDAIDSDLSTARDDESRRQREALKFLLQDMEKRQDREAGRLYHGQNIHIHVGEIRRNHLDDAQRAAIEDRILWHKKAIRELEKPFCGRGSALDFPGR